MKTRPVTVACVVAAIGLVGACAYAFKDRNSRTDPRLAPFEFRLEPAPTPEMAAQAMFLGVATASPRDFVRHLLLGVCENEIDTLQNFAESLHVTRFSHDGEAFTYYELCDQQRMIYRKKPLRVIASADFDAANPKVESLKLEAASSYGGERFVCVEVAGKDARGLEYHSRIVVAQVGEGWYAIPRRRNSRSFYEIADAMSLAPAVVLVDTGASCTCVAESLRDSAVPPPVVQAAYARSANRDSPSHTSLHRQGNHR